MYLDKFGNQILAGMTIRHNNGDHEYVYATQDASGSQDLGICALTEIWRNKHPNYEEEFYSLRSLNLMEWAIVSPSHND